MSNMFFRDFRQINSTAPGFNVNLSTAAVLSAIQSTGTREYEFPTSRTVRVSESSGIDFRMLFGGSSDVVATEAGSPLYLGGAVEYPTVDAEFTHVSIFTTSTQTGFVSLTLGHGR